MSSTARELLLHSRRFFAAVATGVSSPTASSRARPAVDEVRSAMISFFAMNSTCIGLPSQPAQRSARRSSCAPTSPCAAIHRLRPLHSSTISRVFLLIAGHLNGRPAARSRGSPGDHPRPALASASIGAPQTFQLEKRTPRNQPAMGVERTRSAPPGCALRGKGLGQRRLRSNQPAAPYFGRQQIRSPRQLRQRLEHIARGIFVGACRLLVNRTIRRCALPPRGRLRARPLLVSIMAAPAVLRLCSHP